MILVVFGVLNIRGLSFYEQTNPFNITFIGGDNHTYFLNVPIYFYISRLQLNLNLSLNNGTELIDSEGGASTIEYDTSPPFFAQSFIANNSRFSSACIQKGGGDTANYSLYDDNSNKPGTKLLSWVAPQYASCAQGNHEYTLIQGNRYWVVLHNKPNWIHIFRTVSDAYPRGVIANSTDGITWTLNNSVDTIFRVWYEVLPEINISYQTTPIDTTKNKFNVLLNSVLLNNILLNNCNCSNCSIIGSNCNIPITFYSKTSGKINITLINSSGFNNSKLNITIFNENGSLLTQTTNIILGRENFEQENSTATGSILIDNLGPGEYSVSISSAGYSSRTYTVTLSDVNTVYLNAYLGFNTSDVTFTVKDDYTLQLMANVLGTMYKSINNTWTPIESKYTDITGRIQFSYQDDTRYRFYLSKTNYQDYIFILDPVLFDDYDVFMTPIASINESQDYDDIGVIWTPTLFYNSQINNFTFLIQSPAGALINYGYTLTYPGGSTSESGSSALGSQLESNFTITGASYSDTLRMDWYYTTSLAGTRNFTNYYPIAITGYNRTMVGLRDQTYGLGLFERLLIMVIGAIFIVGIATLIGRPIPGLVLGVMFMGMLAYMRFVPLWSILISIAVTLILVGSQMEV